MLQDYHVHEGDVQVDTKEEEHLFIEGDIGAVEKILIKKIKLLYCLSKDPRAHFPPIQNDDPIADQQTRLNQRFNFIDCTSTASHQGKNQIGPQNGRTFEEILLNPVKGW